MISIETIEARASRLIERVLSNRDPDHHRLVFLQWATSLEILLFDEGGEKGRAAALRVQDRIQHARSAILASNTSSTVEAG